jgi:Putative peptidoglycan binding domain
VLKLSRMLLVVFYSTTAVPALALDLGGADGLVDLDAAIGFPTPRTISVFRSADPGDNVYHLIPNSVRLAQSADARPQFSLFHTTDKNKKKTGYITFAVSPVLETDELQAIINEIKASDPRARFAIPSPTQSTFYLVGPEFGRKELTSNTPTSNPLRTPSGFSIDISSIAVRASLTAGSYKQPLFTIGHDFTIRGVERDEKGVLQVASRRFATSFVINGVCALHPELVLDLTTGKHGCLPQSYNHRLVRSLQRQLKTRGYYAGPVDGVFGIGTESAIRSYQRDAALVVDGIPDEELLKRITMVAAVN